MGSILNLRILSILLIAAAAVGCNKSGNKVSFSDPTKINDDNFGENVVVTPGTNDESSISDDAEPVIKPPSDNGDTPAVRPTATPAVRPTATPAVKPTATPAVKPTATPVAVDCTKVMVTTKLDANNSLDRAGLWNNFGPGAGNINKNPEDYHVSIMIQTACKKTVKAMSLLHAVSGEGWSTSSSERFLGKVMYPLVVLAGQEQLIKAYNQSFPLVAGGNLLDIYAQPETEIFRGGKLVIEFSDGQTVAAVIESDPCLKDSEMGSHSCSLVSASSRYAKESGEDRAGIWNNFGPGPGNINKNNEDFKVQLDMRLKTTRVLTAMTMVHNVSGEGWSTSSSEHALGKTAYPLVMVKNGQQQNYRYNSRLLLSSGKHSLDLYMQPETEMFHGGTLILEFSDGHSQKIAIQGDSCILGFGANICSYNFAATKFISGNTNDRAGLWSNFGPGPGNINKQKEDYHVKLSLRTSRDRKVKAISLLHNVPREGWSTSQCEKFLGKLMYPIVVFIGQTQMNYKYDQSLFIRRGGFTLDLYMQPETNPFKGGKLIVEFSDGEVLSLIVPADGKVDRLGPSL